MNVVLITSILEVNLIALLMRVCVCCSITFYLLHVHVVYDLCLCLVID